MSSLFKQNKPQQSQSVDPADLQNRQGLARLRRIAGGGSASTIMSQGMSAMGSSAPRATLTGIG